MADLLVDSSGLREASATLSAEASRVELAASFAAADVGVLGSVDVGAALRDAGVQERARAAAVREGLRDVGSAPSMVAEEFGSVDADLARVW